LRNWKRSWKKSRGLDWNAGFDGALRWEGERSGEDERSKAMSSTTKEKVIQEAKRLISESPSGMRYSELIKKIKELLPGVPPYTIGGSFQKFRANLPPNIYMPGKGLYKDIKYKGSEEPVETTPIPASQSKIEEKEVYEPFARYLENELEGCTKAIVVGGSKFGGKKWGTPDVMGKLEMKKSAIIQALSR
jgi:hypothetical protein